MENKFKVGDVVEKNDAKCLLKVEIAFTEKQAVKQTEALHEAFRNLAKPYIIDSLNLDSTTGDMIRTLNELVDAVNELRSEKNE